MTLSAVNAIRVKYGVPMKGEFECSDPLLTEIWAAGKRTLESCLLDAFVDGPGREQRQYLGDARVQARVARAVLGDERPARRALRSFFLTPRADGMLPIVAPGDAARMGTVIPDYALHGIAMLAEYYEATGDGALVNEVWPSVVRVFDWFFARRRPDGLVGEVPGWVFLDWAQLDKTGANAVMNSLFVQALDAAGRARKDLKPWPIFDDLDTVRRIQDALVRFWDPERALFVDSLDSRGRRSARTSVHANASMVLSGAFGNERFAKWIAVLRQDPSLIVEPQSPLLPPKAIDDVKGIVGASPFFQGFVHEALARLGEHGFVLDDIRKRWGPMVAHGNRNLWEGWERTLDTSDCHAWSATPTAFLTEEILGVRFKVVREATGGTRVAITIAPHSGGLTSASGVVPAPSGPVRVAWEAKGGVITVVRGEVPPGATASVRFGATSRVVQPGRFEITPEN
jgi:hypothetical protein